MIGVVSALVLYAIAVYIAIKGDTMIDLDFIDMRRLSKDQLNDLNSVLHVLNHMICTRCKHLIKEPDVCADCYHHRADRYGDTFDANKTVFNGDAFVGYDDSDDEDDTDD
jgi:hypothetical protein